MAVGRKKNPIETVTLHIAVNTVLHAHLTVLVKKGFHGNCETDAARKIIETVVSELVERGKLVAG